VRRPWFLVLVFACVALGGCATDRSGESDGPALRQMLASSAIDHAVAKIHLALPHGARVAGAQVLGRGGGLAAGLAAR
jgi:hypothetical protein